METCPICEVEALKVEKYEEDFKKIREEECYECGYYGKSTY